jgi:dTDP-4-dehydrorhamnose 3,5-epimerase-like enzyme
MMWLHLLKAYIDFQPSSWAVNMIEGVKHVSIGCYVDDRGFLAQVIQELDAIFPPIKRIYVTGNFNRGVVRGFHKHDREWKCFYVASGAGKFVLVDDRKESKTYKAIDTYILSSRNPSALIIPTGVFNGWMSLDENTIVVGVSSENFDRQNPDDIRVPPETFGDVWTVRVR